MSISYEITLGWMPQDLTGDKSKLIQVMAWCRQATSHYLNQCGPSLLMPCDITRSQWVNYLVHINVDECHMFLFFMKLTQQEKGHYLRHTSSLPEQVGQYCAGICWREIYWKTPSVPLHVCYSAGFTSVETCCASWLTHWGLEADFFFLGGGGDTYV